MKFYGNRRPYLTGNQRPVRRNPLIARTLYYSKDMESFATGLKRIKDVCDKAGCKVEFQTLDEGFVVIFYRNSSKDLGTNTQVDTQDLNKEQVIIEKIMRFCREAHSKKEIAEYLGYKTVKSIKTIMDKLLTEGKIMMTNPEKWYEVHHLNIG